MSLKGAVRIVEKIASRRGGATDSVRCFGDFSSEIQSALLQQAGVEDESLALAAFYKSQDNWALLCFEELIWRQGLRLMRVRWEDLAEVGMQEADQREVIAENLDKDSVSTLMLRTEAGQEYLLDLEAGRGYFIFWSWLAAFF